MGQDVLNKEYIHEGELKEKTCQKQVTSTLICFINY